VTSLSTADLALHARLGITADALLEHQVHRVQDREARELLCINGRPGKMDGIIYPYFDPQSGHVVTRRLRRDHPEYENGKPKNKYISAYGDRRHLNFPVGAGPLLADTTIPVVPLEAEKSMLAVRCAAERRGRPLLPIALGGCYGWRGRIGSTEDVNGALVTEIGPLSDLNRLAWARRDVVLCFDSNASTNAKVQRARRELASELIRRGAAVRILDLPATAGVNGPDDFIGLRGDEAFFALFDAAPDAAAFDVIVRLNAKHAVVREAGKTVVIAEEHDPVLSRRVITRSSFADFRNFYLAERATIGTDPKNGQPISVPVGHFWLTHQNRRQYQGIVMSPTRDVDGYLNLWRGFAVQPQAGDWSRFQRHIFEVICASNAPIYEYVLAWLAFGVQHPDRPAEVALALRGQRGSGKGMFARAYGDLFGQHYLQIANTKHLTGHFNAHLQDAVVLFADEAFWAGDKAGESVLKMLVTEPVIPIERKGRDLTLAKNMLHIILASNHEWVVPAGVDERRFCVLDIDPAYQQDHAYFRELVHELENGGREAMLHDLLHMDITAVNLRAAPQTEALRHQKVLPLPPNERWLFDKLMVGRWLPMHECWETFVAKEELHDDYVKTLQKVGIDRRSTETELGMFMAKMLPSVTTSQKRLGSRRPRGWVVPTLEACRASFDAVTHSAHPWPATDLD